MFSQQILSNKVVRYCCVSTVRTTRLGRSSSSLVGIFKNPTTLLYFLHAINYLVFFLAETAQMLSLSFVAI